MCPWTAPHPARSGFDVSTGELLFRLQGAACTFGRSLHLDDGGFPGWAIGGISRGLAVRGLVVPAARHGSARPVSYLMTDRRLKSLASHFEHARTDLEPPSRSRCTRRQVPRLLRP